MTAGGSLVERLSRPRRGGERDKASSGVEATLNKVFYCLKKVLTNTRDRQYPRTRRRLEPARPGCGYLAAMADSSSVPATSTAWPWLHRRVQDLRRGGRSAPPRLAVGWPVPAPGHGGRRSVR